VHESNADVDGGSQVARIGFMSGIRRRVFCLLMLCGALASPARADSKALFEIALDIDHDGRMDRAVLAGGEGTGSYGPNKDWFMFGADERVALHIYLGAGDAPLDLSRKPSFLKRGIVLGERQNQIFPLKARNGSLIITTAYNLYSNWAQETLTIVHRKGAFLVAGFSRSTDMKSGEQDSCDINFLTGKGVVQKGVDGKTRRLKQHFKPVKLSAWSTQSIPKACR
jgi:hypothetical protein